MRQAKAVAVVAAALCGVAAGPSAAQNTDQVFTLRGSPASGVILATSPTEVTIDVRGANRTIPVNEIRRIGFADDTPDLRRAREDILAGQWENGLAALKKIEPASLQRDLLRADVQYFVAYCQGRLALTGGGDKAAAASALLEFVKANPSSFHFYEAARLLGDLAAAMDSYDNALRYYGAIGRAPWAEYKLQGAVLEASVLVAQAKFSEALAKYADVQSSTVDTPDALRQKLLAQVGSAVCLAETGKPDQGIATLTEIIARNDPQDVELFGRAYNALGRCHEQLKQPKEALLAYLHTDILFYATADAHAEALYHLSKLWAEVKKSDRAVAARNLLLQRYAGSVWARKD